MQDLPLELPIDDFEADSEELLGQLDPMSNIHCISPLDAINQYQDYYPEAACVCEKGHTFMDVFDADKCTYK